MCRVQENNKGADVKIVLLLVFTILFCGCRNEIQSKKVVASGNLYAIKVDVPQSQDKECSKIKLNHRNIKKEK